MSLFDLFSGSEEDVEEEEDETCDTHSYVITEIYGRTQVTDHHVVDDKLIFVTAEVVRVECKDCDNKLRRVFDMDTAKKLTFTPESETDFDGELDDPTSRFSMWISRTHRFVSTGGISNYSEYGFSEPVEYDLDDES